MDTCIMRGMRKAEGVGSQGGISRLRPVDQNPSRPRKDLPSEKLSNEILQAFADLQAALEGTAENLELVLSPEQAAVVVYVREQDKRRILRLIPFEELLRLAPLVKAKRQRLLDRLL